MAQSSLSMPLTVHVLMSLVLHWPFSFLWMYEQALLSDLDYCFSF